MILCTRNIMNTLRKVEKFKEISVEDVVNCFNGYEEHYSVAELFEVLRNSGNFEDGLTSDSISYALKGKSIPASSVEKTIARTTTLTVDQVKECLCALSELVMSYCKSNYSSEGITIGVPYLGKIITRQKKGRKAGSVRRIASDGIGSELKDVTLLNDEPDYLRLFFEFKPVIQETLRQNSSKRNKNNV